MRTFCLCSLWLAFVFVSCTWPQSWVGCSHSSKENVFGHHWHPWSITPLFHLSFTPMFRCILALLFFCFKSSKQYFCHSKHLQTGWNRLCHFILNHKGAHSTNNRIWLSSAAWTSLFCFLLERLYCSTTCVVLSHVGSDYVCIFCFKWRSSKHPVRYVVFIHSIKITTKDVQSRMVEGCSSHPYRRNLKCSR